MPYWVKIILLGIVQGVTEFIPVSSSGHIVIFNEILGVELDEKALALNLLLHLGSLLAVIYFYRYKVWNLIKTAKRVITRSPDVKKEEKSFLFYIILAMIPTTIVGVFIRVSFGDYLFTSTLVTGVCLIITGTLLLITRFLSTEHDTPLNSRRTFLIGLVQGFAVLPGISRSGSTIAASMMQKINGKKAAEFSFMIFIPALIGASLWEYIEYRDVIGDHFFQWTYLWGFLSSLISGFLALKLLLLVLVKEKLHIFSYYCFAAGILTLLYNLV